IGNDVVAFWDRLAAEARGQSDARLLEIGRRGERLTLAYEENRTGRKPKWIAIDSSADGFDVLSIMAVTNRQLMSIEVKSTTVGRRAVFWLTRNEWDTAISAKSHCFHLWDLSVTPPQLAVATPTEIGIHVPQDKGFGEWKSIAIPFIAFDERFC